MSESAEPPRAGLFGHTKGERMPPHVESGAGRDERIWRVYLWPNGSVAVLDLWGHQMPYYQNPDNRAALERAYPPQLWHAWEAPGRCRCGRTLGDYNHQDDTPPLAEPDEEGRGS